MPKRHTHKDDLSKHMCEVHDYCEADLSPVMRSDHKTMKDLHRNFHGEPRIAVFGGLFGGDEL